MLDAIQPAAGRERCEEFFFPPLPSFIRCALIKSSPSSGINLSSKFSYRLSFFSLSLSLLLSDFPAIGSNTFFNETTASPIIYSSFFPSRSFAVIQNASIPGTRFPMEIALQPLVELDIARNRRTPIYLNSIYSIRNSLPSRTV